MDKQLTELAAELAARIERNFKVIPTLTLDQACQELGMCRETVLKLCKDNKLPYIKFDRLYRFKPADINNLLEQHYHGANQ